MKIKWCLIFLVIFLISGCASLSNFNFFNNNKGSVGGEGVILKFSQAPNNGQKLTEADSFYVTIDIENHVPGETPLSGELCLRDSLVSNGGIAENECRPVNLPPASSIDDKTTPSIDSFNFGPYSYTNIEEGFTQPVTMYADLKYEVQALAFATTCVKRLSAESSTIPANCGQEQNLNVQQTDLPIKISKLTTRASSSNTDTTISLDLLLTKVKQGQVVSRSNVLNNDIQGTAEVEFELSVNNQPARCTTTGNNRVEFRKNENEKLVRCSMNLPLNQDHFDAPIRIKMGYGFIQSVPGREFSLVKGVRL